MPQWKKTPLGAGGLMLIEPPVFRDERGEFIETWSGRVFEDLGLSARFVQDNQSLSLRRGTIRGIHYQRAESAQAKLVRCAAGAIRDVAVDLRPESPEFLRVFTADLEAASARMLFIPKGFGHGFATLADHTVVVYKTDAYYDPTSEGAVRWDDPALAVDWGLDAADPRILSKKDRTAPGLEAFLAALKQGG